MVSITCLNYTIGAKNIMHSKNEIFTIDTIGPIVPHIDQVHMFERAVATQIVVG